VTLPPLQKQELKALVQWMQKKENRAKLQELKSNKTK
jgi:uncharacterized protein YjiS (DUF1127 family)